MWETEKDVTTSLHLEVEEVKKVNTQRHDKDCEKIRSLTK